MGKSLKILPENNLWFLCRTAKNYPTIIKYSSIDLQYKSQPWKMFRTIYLASVVLSIVSLTHSFVAKMLTALSSKYNI